MGTLPIGEDEKAALPCGEDEKAALPCGEDEKAALPFGENEKAALAPLQKEGGEERRSPPPLRGRGER